jgi:hypothetical protein
MRFTLLATLLLGAATLPPLGCRDLVAECMCDAKGQNCRWVWRCVK